MPGSFSRIQLSPVSNLGSRSGISRFRIPRASAGWPAAARENGEHVLILDGDVTDAAVLALAVKGTKIRTIVSQGCKPVGEPFTITRAEENLVYAMGSRPAYQVLSETFNGLSDDEKERARGNLFAGLAASEYVADLKRGDFLVRNLLGADPQTGAVAIGAHARTGQTLQYQLRDKITAHADLVDLAENQTDGAGKPFAALVFSCNGRGQNFFGVPNHDAADARRKSSARSRARDFFARRDRPDRRSELPARLHRLGRALLRVSR